VTVTFDGAGARQQLPSNFVPPAYREWGVELFDWASQCSMLATPEGLRYKLRRLMPTVGCEADAVAFTEEGAAAAAGALAVLPDGSYSLGARAALPAPPLPAPHQPPHARRAARPDLQEPPSASCANVPPNLTSVPLARRKIKRARTHTKSTCAGPAAVGEDEVTCEACFPIAPSGASPERLRIVQKLRRHWKSRAWEVAATEVHRERFDEPYTGRQELAGCGGGAPKFADGAPTAAAQLAGAWAAAPGAAALFLPEGGALVRRPPPASLLPAAVAAEAVGLPIGAFARAAAAADGALSLECGVLLEDGAARAVCVRSYDAAGRLAAVALGLERRQ
jgi:hypothetical protein